VSRLISYFTDEEQVAHDAEIDAKLAEFKRGIPAILERAEEWDKEGI